MKPSSRSHGYIKFTVQASLPRDGRSETSYSSAQQVQERRGSWKLPRGRCSTSPRGSSKLAACLSRTGVAAARRKFSPEFLNRLDKIVVFTALSGRELRL